MQLKKGALALKKTFRFWTASQRVLRAALAEHR